jgi:hypothetical protein
MEGHSHMKDKVNWWATCEDYLQTNRLGFGNIQGIKKHRTSGRALGMKVTGPQALLKYHWIDQDKQNDI